MGGTVVSATHLITWRIIMNLLDALRKHDFYSGKTKKTTDLFSVSEIAGGDILQLALRRLHDIPIEEKVTQATLGSIFDAGLRKIIDDLNEKLNTHFYSGYRMEKQLPNGITISGETDILDSENKWIYDAKLSKIFAMQMCEKEKEHQYKLQLNLYRWLLGDNYRMFLLWGLKDQSDANPKHPNEAMMLKEVEHIADDRLISIAVEKSNKVISIVNGNEQAPTKCKDTWRNDVRCKYYCDVCQFCPYYKEVSVNPF